MNTSECFAVIESKYNHLFTTDRENNAITLRPGFGNIPPFTLVCVEGGEFMMGSNYIGKEEKPPHLVNVNGFFMAEFPVTHELYARVTGMEPSNFKGINHPVEQVSWNDALGFCNKLNELLNLPVPYIVMEDSIKCDFQCTAFRLPTEAEWEFAAQGGNVRQDNRPSLQRLTIPYQFASSDSIVDMAWYEKNNNYETKPVGLKFPNALGIYDMIGNVWEWCWDWYDEYYYKSSPMDNPKGPLNGSERVVRGGSWRTKVNSSRVACRHFSTPGNRWAGNGFRILFA